MLDVNALRLYLCTDRVLAMGRPIVEVVEAAIAGGVTMVQLREKAASSREFYEIALEVRKATKRRGIPLVVNDRLDIALAVGADGLHIGRSDLPPGAARRIAGDRLFIGVSAGAVEEALAAEKRGADYLGVGAVFPTGSKADAGDAIGLKELRAICAAVTIPVVGIGGINSANAADVMRSGTAGIAVISAILSQPDIKAAAEALNRNIGAAALL
jgi:thiamine-phosphate pyrophosphorylase